MKTPSKGKTHPNPREESWEEKFDKMFDHYNPIHDDGVRIPVWTGFDYALLKSFIKEAISSAVATERGRSNKETIDWIMKHLYEKYPEACNAFNELFLEYLDKPPTD